MQQSARLIFNGAVQFGRMVLTFGVGLYSTRVLVNILGHSDYGLLAVLGASGLLLMFVGRALNTSAQRYLARELGRGNHERVLEVFNSTLVLFLGVSLAVLLAGILLEPIVIRAVQIPEGRESAASQVFTFTLLGLVAISAVTPFRCLVYARQAMGQLALFDIIRSLLGLASALLLFVVEGDYLVIYAGLLLGVTLLRSLGMVIVCLVRFPESRPNVSKFRRSEFGRIARFAGWATLINLGGQVYMQATIVLLSIAFSPVVTAAYAIAMRVGSYHTNFSRVLPQVVQPAMTALEARGSRDRVRELALLTGRYSSVGVLFLVVPMMLETKGILRTWLGDYPPETPLFVRLAMVWLTVQVLSSGFDRAVYAHGKIAPYALWTTATWVVSLSLSSIWIFVLELDSWTVPATILAMTLAQIPLRVGYAGGLVGLGYRSWLRETVWKAAMPALPATGAALLAHHFLPDGGSRQLMVVASYGIVAAPATWFFSVGQEEKEALLRFARSAWIKLRARLSGA